MLFSYFDSINYKDKSITDIFRNYKAYFDKAASGFILKSYTISGAPRPEVVAYSLYGNTDLYWVLLMLNDIRDPFHGWIKTQTACYESADQKYRGQNQILYHVNSDGQRFYNLTEHPESSNLWYDKGDTKRLHLQYDKPLKAVDIYEDAINENEKLRYIRVIDERDITNFISRFIKEMETA